MRMHNPSSRPCGLFLWPTQPTHSRETAGLKGATAHMAHSPALWLKPFLHKVLQGSGLWAIPPYIYTWLSSPLGHHEVPISGGLLVSQYGGDGNSRSQSAAFWPDIHLSLVGQ